MRWRLGLRAGRQEIVKIPSELRCMHIHMQQAQHAIAVATRAGNDFERVGFKFMTKRSLVNAVTNARGS